MKKLFTLLAMVGLAFASCTPGTGPGTPDEGQQVLGAGEFTMSVTNVGEISADLKIAPKAEGRTFYWNLATKAQLAEYATTAAFMQDYYDYLKENVDAGNAVWSEILDSATVEYTTEKLNPNTNYVLWAFGIDVNGNLTSSDLSYVEFTTKESTFDASQWYGYWEVTSPKQVVIGEDPMSGYLVEEVVEESLTKSIVIVPGDEYLNEGEVYVYGFDGVFDWELPAVGTLSANSIKMINGYVLFTEEDEMYGPLDYTWNGYSYLQSYGAFYTIGGSYAPYTITMATDGSVKVVAYQGTITSGEAFMTDYYALSAVITTGQYEGYSLSFVRTDGQPAQYLSGAEMTAVKVGELEDAELQKLSKKVKAAHKKVATPKATAQKFSAAVKFAK